MGQNYLEHVRSKSRKNFKDVKNRKKELEFNYKSPGKGCES